MLRVVDLSTGSSLSCTLNPQTSCAQVIQAIKSRISQTSPSPTKQQQLQASLVHSSPSLLHSASEDQLYAVWMDSKNKLKAKRMRMDDCPLVIVSHLKATTNGKRTPNLVRPEESCNLILAKEGMDERAFRERGVELDPHSHFFSAIQQLSGNGDLCGYFITNNELPPWWWILHGERLWYYPEGHEKMNAHPAANRAVSLVNAKLQAVNAMEFELQTPLMAFRLRATSFSPAEIKTWMETIQFRINVATDNELILLADAMIGDEERLDWRERDLQVWAQRMEDFDAWWTLLPARALLVGFALQNSNADYDLCQLYERIEGKSARVIVAQYGQYLAQTNSSNSAMDEDDEQEAANKIMDKLRHDVETRVFAPLKQNAKLFERFVAGLALL